MMVRCKLAKQEFRRLIIDSPLILIISTLQVQLSPSTSAVMSIHLEAVLGDLRKQLYSHNPATVAVLNALDQLTLPVIPVLALNFSVEIPAQMPA
jgi:hypothetical protein